MGEGDTVRLETAADGVATVRLDRPALHNAFDEGLIVALSDTLRQVAADPAVRVVVLAASGKSFSAGADLNWMRRMAGLAALMQLLHDLPKPTVARVQGAAYGGGVGLVACCDIAIAAEEAQFALTEVRLGLIPAVISPYVVAAIGARAARRYFITGERFGAAEAARLGLVHRVAPAAGLDEAVAGVLAAIAEGGPEAQRQAKALVADVADRAIDPALVEMTVQRIAAPRAGRVRRR